MTTNVYRSSIQSSSSACGRITTRQVALISLCLNHSPRVAYTKYVANWFSTQFNSTLSLSLVMIISFICSGWTNI